MQDLKDAKPGDVFVDRDGNVWGVLHDGRIVPIMLAGGHITGLVPREAWADALAGLVTRLVPEEREEW